MIPGDLPGWLLLLSGGGLAELTHAAVHHRAELAGIVLAVVAWLVRLWPADRGPAVIRRHRGRHVHHWGDPKPTQEGVPA